MPQEVKLDLRLPDGLSDLGYLHEYVDGVTQFPTSPDLKLPTSSFSSSTTPSDTPIDPVFTISTGRSSSSDAAGRRSRRQMSIHLLPPPPPSPKKKRREAVSPSFSPPIIPSIPQHYRPLVDLPAPALHAPSPPSPSASSRQGRNADYALYSRPSFKVKPLILQPTSPIVLRSLEKSLSHVESPTAGFSILPHPRIASPASVFTGVSRRRSYSEKPGGAAGLGEVRFREASEDRSSVDSLAGAAAAKPSRRWKNKKLIIAVVCLFIVLIATAIGIIVGLIKGNRSTGTFALSGADIGGNPSASTSFSSSLLSSTPATRSISPSAASIDTGLLPALQHTPVQPQSNRASNPSASSALATPLNQPRVPAAPTSISPLPVASIPARTQPAPPAPSTISFIIIQSMPSAAPLPSLSPPPVASPTPIASVAVPGVAIPASSVITICVINGFNVLGLELGGTTTTLTGNERVPARSVCTVRDVDGPFFHFRRR